MIVSVRHAQPLDGTSSMKLSHGRCTNPLFPNLWLAAHLFVFKNPQTLLRYKCRLDIQEETTAELSKLQNHNCIYKKHPMIFDP